jgi:hypothetical protein
MTGLDPKNPVRCNFHKNRGKDQGDVLIRGLCGTGCIMDVNAVSNCSKDPQKVLNTHNWEKKKKYLEACLEQRRHFTPCVVSIDGLLGKEGKTLLKKLSSVLAEK